MFQAKQLATLERSGPLRVPAQREVRPSDVRGFKINIELDQCWDLLRQRQALRDAGRNPDEAHVRPPEIVENYEQ
jgi:Protein of unknown function (DUF2630)